MFPITDGSGRVVDIYGRWPGPGVKLGIPCDRFLSEVRHGVWNVQGFGDTDEVIICPSLFDALIFWNAGLRNVTCTFGPNALTEDHVTALRERGIRRVYLMVESIAPQLRAAGIECWQLYFPHGLDVDGYVRGCPDPSRGSTAILAEAVKVGAVAAPPSQPEQATVAEIQPKARWSKRPAVPMRLRLDDDQKLLAQILNHYCLAPGKPPRAWTICETGASGRARQSTAFASALPTRPWAASCPPRNPRRAGKSARLQQVGFFGIRATSTSTVA